MSKSKRIPEFKNYQEMADFWDTHSLADYWEETEPAKFEVSQKAYHHYWISVDRDLLDRVQRLARKRGVTTESLVNLLIEQRLHEIEATIS